MGVLLVVMAHPDDAELMCYGAIKKYAARGYECHLLLLTKGEQSTFNEGSREDRGKYRIAETKKAFSKVDINISCLDFTDGFIRQDYMLMATLQQQMERIDPTVVITHYPDGGWLEHQDHNALGNATYSAAIRYAHNLEKVLFTEPLFSNFISFHPNLLISIDEYFEEKVEILKHHVSQDEKFYIDEKFLEMRAASMSPYIRINGERFTGKFELFYQVYAVEF
ncbi:MAG: PIG-L family deacetylase [Clostridiales Family XIII bacterium]|jgi:LmbE family N-acetylglucosaminyl deacetylase|nr:PIG-L family deacetylase [Clostridiales Family XIII bacterium]